MKKEQIGLQVYTVRSQFQEDMRGTLKKLADLGYRNLEMVYFLNKDPKAIRAVLDEFNLRAISTHTPFESLQSNPQEVFENIRSVGGDYIIVPWVKEEARNSRDAMLRTAENLNTMGRASHDAGFRFGYHNHAFEFAPIDGTTWWDVLTQETDPALVELEIDVYWVHYAEQDAAALISQFGKRVKLLHIKDGEKDSTDASKMTMVAVGEGIVPIADIIRAGDEAGVEWFIVEQDVTTDTYAEISTSLRYMLHTADNAVTR